MTTDDILTSTQSFLNKSGKIDSLNDKILAYGAAMRPGCSPDRVIARIISRQSEYGAPTGELGNTANNMINGLITVVVEEVFRELRMYARVESSGLPGSAKVTVAGANAGGGFVATGASVDTNKSCGVIV